MKHSVFAGLIALACVGMAAEVDIAVTVPAPPTRDEWTFRRELATPQEKPYSLIPEGKKPWVENRITRCFFGPIKRPPFNRDELMDEIDYYPDEYLKRLHREGMNGLWLTIEFRNLVETSFNKRDKDAAKRLKKLNATVQKCLKYGIKTWIFAIEPRSLAADDPLAVAHPDWLGVKCWDGRRTMCTSVAGVRQYLEEAMKDLFTQVPDLAGLINISHGERPTTCLSALSCTTGKWQYQPNGCPRCSRMEPWQVHYQTMEAMSKGMRAANPAARIVSWFYQPQPMVERAEWVFETARHIPEGVCFQYNFESGALKKQGDRYRIGGDYWLSYTGPSLSFERVAEAAKAAHVPLAAKIQTGCSHECATVPFVPVPGLLYRKYKAMKAAGVTTVMQCWYFGNYPGIMNEAAGLLSYEDFTDDEAAFLKRLAAPAWGADAEQMANLWQRYSDAYANYPLSNDMQYYGPFHNGFVWALLPDVTLQPLARTWKPLEPVSGDAIGECLENHTLDEALELANAMAAGVQVKTAAGEDALDAVCARHAGERERVLDIGVMKTLRMLFESGRNIFAFYRIRSEGLWESRVRKNAAGARACVRKMGALVEKEAAISRAMIPLCEQDSRLGFHSEAEAHQFHPKYLKWRLDRLDEATARLKEIDGVLAQGGTWPESAFETRAANVRVGGDWAACTNRLARIRATQAENGDVIVEAEGCQGSTYRVCWTDAAGTRFPAYAEATAKGGKFRVTLEATAWGNDARLRPGWMEIIEGHNRPVWPTGSNNGFYRLNLGSYDGRRMGRLIYH